MTTGGISIASPQDMQQLNSPVQVTGVNTAFTAETSTIIVLDHDRAAIGQASSSGKAAFAIPIPYSSSFQDGTQEGILALYTYSASHVIVGAVMVKVLLNT